jgi:hypothetical protein
MLPAGEITPIIRIKRQRDTDAKMFQLPFERQYRSAEEALASAIEYAREHIAVSLIPEREHSWPEETGVGLPTHHRPYRHAHLLPAAPVSHRVGALHQRLYNDVGLRMRCRLAPGLQRCSSTGAGGLGACCGATPCQHIMLPQHVASRTTRGLRCKPMPTLLLRPCVHSLTMRWTWGHGFSHLSFRTALEIVTGLTVAIPSRSSPRAMRAASGQTARASQ